MNLRPISTAYHRTRLMNFRTHRKIAVIDGRTGYTGGMNITRVQSAEFAGAAAWRDTHLRLTGAAVAGLQETFLQQWNYINKRTLYADSLYPAAIEAGAIPVQVVRSGPVGGGQPIRDTLVSALYAARRHAFITTPYLIPDETLLTALRTAVLRGVDVRLLVPVRGDSRLVTAAARSYHGELLDAGVRLYEYGPPMLHAKTAVIDDWYALIGSCNLDPRSFKLNFEVAAAVYDPARARTLTEWFSEDLAGARELTARALAERERNPARRLLVSAARIASPLL
jgi:cardiolipin synthase